MAPLPSPPLGAGNSIHPTAIVAPTVRLGEGNVIGPYVVLAGRTEVGDRNWFGPHTCVGLEGDIVGRPSAAGTPWWELDEPDSPHGVRIGSGNVLKEAVTIHAGSHRPTVVGDDCYLMPRSHLGHDVWVGDRVLLSPGAQVAGHVAIGDFAVIGMAATVHQFCNVGPVAMVGMSTPVRTDVEPGRTVAGDPQRVTGVNKIGLARALGEETVPGGVVAALRAPDTYDRLPERLADAVARWSDQIVRR